MQGYAAEYEISKIWSHENDSFPIWDAQAINEQGQILGSNYELGTILIDVDGKITKIPHNTAIAINNNGSVLVKSKKRSFIWNKKKDLVLIDVFNSPKVDATGINDKNQVIGKYVSAENSYGNINCACQERAFFWEKGEAIDFSPEYIMANDKLPIGYRISEINLMCINNHGDIAGYCFCVYIDEQHGLKKIIKSGFVPFLWNGFHLEFLPIVLQNNASLRRMKLQ